MKSNVLQKDRIALIKLNQALSPQERLSAFYQHSLLLSLLASARKEGPKKDVPSAIRVTPSSQK